MPSSRPCAQSGAILVLTALMAAPGAAASAAVAVTPFTVDSHGPARATAKGAGDLDHDGLADFVVGSAAGGVYWYRNAPGWPRRTIDATLKTAEKLVVADLADDGDRALDVIVAIPGGIVWFENDGNGTGWTRRTLESGQSVHDIVVADFDGDGKPDVAGRGDYPRGSKVYFWRKVSATSFAQSDLTLPETGTGLVAVDLDGNRKSDIAVGKYWYANAGTPGRIGFSAAHTYSASAERDALLAAGDLDGDGDADLLVTPPHPTIAGQHKVAWYEAPADPTRSWTQHVLVSNAQPVVHTAIVADLDGDRDNDLVTAEDSLGASPQIKAYLNDGRGTFTAQTVASDAQHAMQFLKFGGKPSIVGADYNEKPSSTIQGWQFR